MRLTTGRQWAWGLLSAFFVVSCLIAEQSAKTLLLEVLVIGERFGQALPAHRLHGNAIDQAVPLVGPLAVKIEAGQKRSAALRDHPDNGVGENALYAGGGPTA